MCAYTFSYYTHTLQQHGEDEVIVHSCVLPQTPKRGWTTASVAAFQMKTLPNMLRSCDNTAASQTVTHSLSVLQHWLFICFVFLKTTSLWNNVSSGIVYFLKVQNQIGKSANTKTDALKQLTDVEDKTLGPEWRHQEREVPVIWMNTFVITSPHTRESWVTRVLHRLWRTVVWVFFQPSVIPDVASQPRLDLQLLLCWQNRNYEWKTWP